MFLIDSHCHLDCLNYKNIHKDIDDVIKKAELKEIKYILSVATTLSNFIKMKQEIGYRKNVGFSCGIHPLNLNENDNFNLLLNIASDSEVLALGETGLDYYHQNNNIQLQEKSLRAHIRIARQLNKPVIIHSRESKNTILAILREENIRDCGGVLHSFTGDKQTAKILLDLGLYISLSGIITFRSSEEIRQVVRFIPLNRILIESDAPYLSPIPYRGKENQPAYVREVAKCLAQIKKVDLETIAEITTKNFFELMHLKITID
ncbi:YchF/TatD family DNA exonuclease [Arsenophonus symbiont of Ornithomya chloropus]|uniref:YchF/TatD family DNA exonuclease n=1 Tax=Arsenophonus symbiont of Ornithomya chloropus TaxID=634121 RepID=UPI0032B240FD